MRTGVSEAPGPSAAHEAPEAVAGPQAPPADADLDTHRAAAKALAILRLLLLPIVFAGDRLVDHDLVGTGRFDVVLAAAAVYSLLVLIETWRPRGPALPLAGVLVCDVLFVAALTYESGGAFSQLRAAFLALMLGAALLGAPRRTAAVALATGVLYMIVAVLHPVVPGTRKLSVALAQGLYLVWFGLAAVVLAALLNARRKRILDLAAARGRLVAQAVSAEERAHRTLSGYLHDEVIQTLLATRQDLAEARAGRAEMLAPAECALRQVVDQLRAIVVEVHPNYLLDHLDLESVLHTIAQQQAVRGGFKAHLRVDPALPGTRSQLMLSLARELLVNVAQHAAADNVVVTLSSEGDELVLEVADDGCGFTEHQRRAALQAGHIGLASARERVEVAGGAVEISSAPGTGTSVRCRIPAQSRTEGANRPQLPTDGTSWLQSPMEGVNRLISLRRSPSSERG